MQVLFVAAFLTVATRAAGFVAFPPRPSTQPWRKSGGHVAQSKPDLPASTVGFPAGISSTSLYGSLIDEKELLNFFFMKLIENGVPAAFTIITILVASKAFKKENQEPTLQVNPAVSDLYEDLYGSQQTKKRSFMPSFLPRKDTQTLSRNTGIPSQQYIKVTNWNEKYDSYEFNMMEATQSKASAAASLRSKNFNRALKLSNGKADLEPHQKAQLLRAEQALLTVGTEVMASIASAETQLTDIAILEEMENLGIDLNSIDPAPVGEKSGDSNSTSSSFNSLSAMSKKSNSGSLKRKKILENELMNSQKTLLQVETRFIQNVTQILGPTRVAAFRAATLGDIATRGIGQLLKSVQQRPLSTILSPSNRTRSVFVMRFPGDVQASQVNAFREEVTAVVRAAKEGDEALLVLQSGGGTVTGYGLAAGQLKRFKEAGIKLTICVEQVAASGGYMMCCVADRIVASPMAVLGSIGVITDIPNVYERLQKEGIEFQTVTAGKYKRTLTPTKKPTKEDVQKTKEDIENVLTLFKAFVHENRPSLDIDDVATGETWFGTDALKKNLCDEIKTADDVLIEFVENGYDVYEIKYLMPLEQSPFGKLLPSAERSEPTGFVGRAIRLFMRTVKTEFEAELSGSSRITPETQYMMKDETADRIRFD